jgi:hypothetical protein
VDAIIRRFELQQFHRLPALWGGHDGRYDREGFGQSTNTRFRSRMFHRTDPHSGFLCVLAINQLVSVSEARGIGIA